MTRLLWIAVLVPVFAMAGAAAELQGPFDGLQAGAEAAARIEAEQLERVRLQLATIEQMKWLAGFPPSLVAPDSRQPIARPEGADGSSQMPADGTVHWYYDWPRPPLVWSPWNPDIWGYAWLETTRQPIGRVQRKTGPNRWESHPVYAQPPAAPPPVEEIPAPAPSGPREF